ncbi:hypothetical protein Maq22A_c02400 [Methylobacterium aquaticum]|uniref:Uncharacterized protein n=2 Tax=Methylobacterium aquaticum TaxID=270351 RepID=A0A0C6FAX3_9HYPH|nr:hypothetical protein Maq22A_c02400 [Methylobacterium aquaticum]
MRQGVADLMTRAQVDAYVGPSGEILSDGETLRLHDGAAPGGNPLATQAQVPGLSADRSGIADAGGDLSSGLAKLAAAGGGRPRLPRAGYRLVSPLVMREATCVEGQGSSPSSYAGQGTVFTVTPAASNGLVGPTSGAVHTTGLRDFTIDARALRSGGAAVRAGFLESRFSNVKIQGAGSYDQGGYTANTIGFHHVATAPSWINWSKDMLIGGFAVGKRMEGSDSLDTGHYISGNQIGYQVAKSTASLRTGHMMIDLSSGAGMDIQAPDQTDASGNALPAASAGTHTGHIFHFNNLHLAINNLTWSTPADFLHAFSGCVFHYGKVAGSPAVLTSSNARGLTFAGCIFYQNRGADFQFGPNNSGHTLHFSSDQAPNDRIIGMPLDSHVLSGGIGGQYNYLNSLILNSPGNPGGKIQETRLAVYGNDGVLSASGVSARFGLGRDAAGFDAALLAGNDNGNAPYLDGCDGERTTAAQFVIKFRHTARLTMDAVGTLVGGLLSALTSNTVLGATNVVARFGLGKNIAGVDAAMLLGSENGNTPFIDIANGEQTNAAGFNVKWRHSARFGLDGTGNFKVVPQVTATPEQNGDLVLEKTSDTVIKIKVRGSDGVVRSTTLTLS